MHYLKITPNVLLQVPSATLDEFNLYLPELFARIIILKMFIIYIIE
jgi:hypothetical protein